MAEFNDEVKHIESGMTGVVIAEYTVNDIRYFDVRTEDDYHDVRYATPAANWQTIVASADRE